MEFKNPNEGVAPLSQEGAPKTATMRTMRGDVAEAVKKQNETLVSIALAEERKKAMARGAKILAAQRAAEAEGAPARRGRFVLVVVVLLMIGGFFLGYKYLIPILKNQNINLGSLLPKKAAPTAPEAPLVVAPVVETPAPINTTPTVPSIIQAQAEKIFTLDKANPSKTFAEVAAERVLGDTGWTIKNLVFSDTPAVATNRLLSLAGVPAPEILGRSLTSSFMAGFIMENGSSIPTPFLILKTNSYTNARAGMLSWEPKLPKLFDTIFGTSIESGLSTTSKTKDVIILKKDARVLEITPNIGMAYAFANQSTIVITASRTALEQLIPLAEK